MDSAYYYISYGRFFYVSQNLLQACHDCSNLFVSVTALFTKFFKDAYFAETYERPLLSSLEIKFS